MEKGFSTRPDPLLPVHNPDLPLKSPPGVVYRIGRAPDPWSLPDWTYVGDDGTFGNRFDDSESHFRVLYAASSPVGCFVETLARYRKPPEIEDLIAAFNAIDNGQVEPLRFGQVPVSWTALRMLGEAIPLRKRFADIYSAEWLSYLRRKLEPGLMAKRLNAKQDFDLALLGSQDRQLTQQIATVVYQLGYDGIYYQSRHGTNLDNWALFEPVELTQVSRAPINAKDPNLHRALDLLNLSLDPRL